MHLRLFIAATVTFAVLFQALQPSAVQADRIQLLANPESELTGEILVEAQDGGVLFLCNDGQLRIIQPNEIADKVKEVNAAPPISKKEFSQQLLEELPEGFKIHSTRHYLVAYQTERAYAKWIGNLYEGKLTTFALRLRSQNFR